MSGVPHSSQTLATCLSLRWPFSRAPQGRPASSSFSPGSSGHSLGQLYSWWPYFLNNKTKIWAQNQKRKKRKPLLFSLLSLGHTVSDPHASSPSPTPTQRSQGSFHLLQALGASGQSRGRKLSISPSKILTSSPSKPGKNSHTHRHTDTQGQTPTQEPCLQPQGANWASGTATCWPSVP